jgi:protein CpxP
LEVRRYRNVVRAFAVTAIVASLIVGAALAQEMGPGPGPGMGFGGPPMMIMRGPGGPPPFMMLLRSANLSADQQKQVRQILESDRATAHSNFEKLHSIHEQIAEKLLSPGSVTASDLAPLQQQAEKIQQQMDEQRLQTALKIRALLSADQLKKVAQTHQKMKSLFEQMSSIMGPPGSPE